MGRLFLDQPFPVGLRTVESGTHPVARHHHLRARFDMAVMHRRKPHRLEVAPRQNAQLFPGDRGTDGRGPHPGEVPAGAIRCDAERVGRRIPALRRTHSDGRIALRQLDIGVTLVDRVGQVAKRQVLVEIDELLAPAVGEDRPGVVALPAGVGRDRRRVTLRKTERLRRRRPAGMAAFGDRPAQVMSAIDRAGGKNPLRHPVDAEAGQRPVVNQPGTGMAGDVGGGHVAGAHAQQVAGDRLSAHAEFAGVDDRGDGDRPNAAGAEMLPGLGRGMPRDDPNFPLGDRRSFGRRVGVPAKIDHRRDLDTGLQQVEGGGVSFPAGGRDHGPVAGPDPVMPDQPLRRRKEHRAGQVVVAEHDRLLDRAGRHHDLLCPNLVQTPALDDREPVVGEPALAGGSGHRIDGFDPLDRGDERAKLLILRRAIDPETGIGERPARRGLIVDQQDVRPGFRGARRGGQPGGTRADNDDIVEAVFLVEPAGLGGGIDLAEAGAGPEHRLPSLPRAGRPVKRLVVEPDGQKAGEEADPRAPGRAPGCRRSSAREPPARPRSRGWPPARWALPEAAPAHWRPCPTRRRCRAGGDI